MSERRKNVLKYFEEQKDYMNDRVQLGIEQHRKGWVSLNFHTKDGKPVSNVHVEAKQKTHDFKYGANLFMLDELETEEKNAAYKELFADAFNLATLPFYWSDLEPEQGKPRYSKDSPRIYRRPTPDLCLEYCEANGITPKAHCLNYEVWTPKWVPEDVKSMKYYLNKRMTELAERYAGRIHGWEVTNETFWEYHLFDQNRYCSPFFRDPNNVEWSFECARRHFPLNELIINEASQIWTPNDFAYNRSSYYMQIERALAKGAEIDAVGMQFHMFFRAEDEAEKIRTYYDPRHLYKVMDQYAKLGKPMQITEVTIPCYTDQAEDEELQAEILRHLYRIWFSSEQMESIIYWNLVDGYAAFAPQGDMSAGENYYRGGLVRFDFTPKPAYYVVRDLFKKEWHTEASADSCSDGSVSFKGFYGDYELTVTADGKTCTLPLSFKKNQRNDYHLELPW